MSPAPDGKSHCDRYASRWRWRRIFSEGIGTRQGSLMLSSSHLVCWMVIEADTVANAS